jgi:hypothetical protein
MSLAVSPDDIRHAALGRHRPDDPQGRIGVYRNNHVAGLVRALEGTFPVSREIVGSDFFAAMAAEFVAERPPRSPIMSRYGAAFPDFIASFPPAAAIDYLADVARLEWLRVEVYHAADAPQAPPPASEDPERLLAAKVTRHPAARLLSVDHPTLSIWRAHQEAAQLNPIVWSPEVVLIARPQDGLTMSIMEGAELATWRSLKGPIAVGELLETTTGLLGEIEASRAFVSLIQRGAVAF